MLLPPKAIKLWRIDNLLIGYVFLIYLWTHLVQTTSKLSAKRGVNNVRYIFKQTCDLPLDLIEKINVGQGEAMNELALHVFLTLVFHINIGFYRILAQIDGVEHRQVVW